MVSDYDALTAGQELCRRAYTLDEPFAAAYVAAVEDESGALTGDSGEPLVPAMAVAALSIQGVIQELRIPGGTLHAGQEFEFLSAVPVGWSLECVATLAQHSTRGGWRFLVIDCEVTGKDSEPVMTGKSTIMIPAALGPREMAQQRP